MTWDKSGGYPEPGVERSRSIAWVVLDEIATQPMIHGSIREALYGRLGTLVEQGEQQLANEVLHAFLDCWSLGAVVDDARDRWFHSADPKALAVLIRAAEVIQLAIGWSAGPAGPWPVPDESWFTANNRDWASAPTRAVDGIVEVSCDDLVAEHAEWMARIRDQNIVALHVTGLPTDAAAFNVAMREASRASSRQVCFDRAGFAAMHVESVPNYGEGWTEAQPGNNGEVLQTVADGVVVPALDTGAPMAMVGWLVWPNAHLPVRVHPITVAVLQEIDGRTPSLQIAEKLDIPGARWSEIVGSVVELGAATAVD